jgi:hypothetical protein
LQDGDQMKMKDPNFEGYFQMNPNQAVVRGMGQHVQVTSRTGEVKEFMLDDAAEVAQRCKKYEAEGYARYVRLRTYWGDNSHGNGRAVVHVILDKDAKTFDPARLVWPTTTKNGQSLDVTVHVTEENVGSDRFEANAEGFYKGLPE